MIGKTVSHYRILKKIGQGGMGVIYLAEDTRLQRKVALKFLPEHLLGSDTEKSRFMHEARAAAALDHPNICTIHEINEIDGNTFIAMTFVEGESLKQKIEARPLALTDAVRYAVQISNGLKEAHRNEVVHRDVKSANVVISNRDHAVVMDFGLAKLRGQTRLTREGTTVGTVSYMSPEQARGEDVDRRSDVWSLGVVLYEMLTGRLPFRGEHDSAVAYAILNEDAEPVTALRSDIPMDLERIVNKAMAKVPQERYQTVDDMLVDLKAVQKGLPSSPTTDSRAPVNRRTVIGYAAAAVAVIAVAFVLYLWNGNRRGDTGTSGLPPRTAVAVLPLDNISNDPGQEYIADGMTESLITQLAQISALRVISRTSAMQYKETARSLRDIARELGVGTIVEGSVLLAGDRVRITAQLIDAATDEHLWAASYDRDMSDVLAIHSEVAMAVAEAVRAELTSQETFRLEHARTVDPAAYQYYLRGLYHWNRRNRTDLEKSIGYFKQAIEIDPGYAEAYTGVAAAYLVMSTHASVRNRDTHPLVKDYARKSLDINPDLAETHAVLGGIAAEGDWDWDEAEARFKKAIELNPSCATAQQWYAEYLHNMGRWDEALEEIRVAKRLDPLSLIIRTVESTIVFNLYGYDESRVMMKDVLEKDPEFQIAWLMLSVGEAIVGRYDESVDAFLTYLRLYGVREESIDTLREAHDRGGFEEFCRTQIRLLRLQSETEFVPPQLYATAFAYLNDADSTFHYIELCYRERSSFMLKVWPPFHRFRDDPRYADLLRRMNLPR
jgi:serine/threonine-protein kinase